MKGIVTKSTGSWYRIRVSETNEVEARLPGKFKLEDKKITNPIAVGDHVVLEHLGKDEYLIQEIENRTNYVIRASPKKKGFSHLIAANVDQAVLIASYRQPRTSTGFIDRFFVTLETFRIPGLLLINKTDIYDEDDMEMVHAICDLYENAGYKTHATSLENDGISKIEDWFDGKTTLLSGHSGSGKSTLINLLSPEAHQQISTVSEFSEKGVHTTTFAEMFSVNPHSHVIDTPGIKELGLAEVYDEELSHYFPEMRLLLGKCKFHNCLHTNEPGCVIKEAVKKGDIHPSRYYSYLSILENEDNRR